MRVTIRPDGARTFPSVESALLFALSFSPSRGIDYAGVSLRDNGHQQRELLELRGRVLACLSGLPAPIRQALCDRTTGHSLAHCARVARVRACHVGAVLADARATLAYRMRLAGLLPPAWGYLEAPSNPVSED